jgi:hypothetical protein
MRALSSAILDACISHDSLKTLGPENLPIAVELESRSVRFSVWGVERKSDISSA